MKTVKEENRNDVLKETFRQIGAIRNCKLLNIRKAPSLDSDILGTLNCESQFFINVRGSTNDFYKISYKGVSGYCLKKFVKIVGSERGE